MKSLFPRIMTTMFLVSLLQNAFASDGPPAPQPIAPQPVAPKSAPQARKPGAGISEATRKQMEQRKGLEQQTLGDEELGALFQTPAQPPAKAPAQKPTVTAKIKSLFKRK